MSTKFIVNNKNEMLYIGQFCNVLRNLRRGYIRLNSKFINVNIVEEIKGSKKVTEFDIKLNKDDEIENGLSKLQSLKSIGEMNVVKTETELKSGISVTREAQVQLREQSNIHNLTINIETSIHIKMDKLISDIICLIDGKVIIVSQDGIVYLLTSEGNIQKQLPISGKAWSVTQINKDDIAITYPNVRAIKMFKMENETVTKVITLDKDCWGLSFSNNSLAVSLSYDEIRIIDLVGNTLRSIKVESVSNIWNLVYTNDRIIYSDYYDKAVYCVDGSGKQIWQYTQDLSVPQGLCTDTYGNIFLADKGPNKIVVISKDGQKSKTLVSDEDGLDCICFKHNESSGFICDNNSNYLTKFSLSHA